MVQAEYNKYFLSDKWQFSLNLRRDFPCRPLKWVKHRERQDGQLLQTPEEGKPPATLQLWPPSKVPATSAWRLAHIWNWNYKQTGHKMSKGKSSFSSVQQLCCGLSSAGSSAPRSHLPALCKWDVKRMGKVKDQSMTTLWFYDESMTLWLLYDIMRNLWQLSYDSVILWCLINL